MGPVDETEEYSCVDPLLKSSDSGKITYFKKNLAEFYRKTLKDKFKYIPGKKWDILK